MKIEIGLLTHPPRSLSSAIDIFSIKICLKQFPSPQNFRQLESCFVCFDKQGNGRGWNGFKPLWQNIFKYFNNFEIKLQFTLKSNLRKIYDNWTIRWKPLPMIPLNIVTIALRFSPSKKELEHSGNNRSIDGNDKVLMKYSINCWK